MNRIVDICTYCVKMLLLNVGDEKYFGERCFVRRPVVYRHSLCEAAFVCMHLMDKRKRM